jgi:hypothetical protein
MANSDPWWIVREGTLGQIVSSLTPSQLLNLSVQYHAVQAAKKPNSTALGPYPTQAAATAAADAQNAGQAGLNKAAGAAASAASSIPGLGGLASVGQFFDRLTEGNTWIRVGEVLLGLALVVVGTAKLFGNTSIGKTATKAAKLGALL